MFACVHTFGKIVVAVVFVVVSVAVVLIILIRFD
jgi:hypothetical protein